MSLSADAVVFDLDGTLADTLPDLAASVNFALAAAGLPTVDETRMRSFLGNGSKVLIEKALGKSLDPETFRTVFGCYMTHYAAHATVRTRPFDGMPETLSKLRQLGKSLFVLTNKPQKPAREIIDTLFAGLFSEVVGNSGAVPTKPDPTGISMLMRRYGLRRERVCYVGDSDVDMILAGRAGLGYKVGCAYGYRPVEELKAYKPDAIISRPAELLALPFLA